MENENFYVYIFSLSIYMNKKEKRDRKTRQNYLYTHVLARRNIDKSLISFLTQML